MAVLVRMNADDSAPRSVTLLDLPIQRQTTHDVRFWDCEPGMSSSILIGAWASCG